MAECLFIKADEVVKMLGVSQSEAYRIIKKLNEEMAAKGYITMYRKFNIERPDDFTGHSLSISDIVAMKQRGVVSYHYVDSIGYKELPAFMKPENYLKNAEMQMEDDYGMIDGVINNGPKEAEKPVKMAVYKEEKTNTWRVIYRYTDWTGEKKQTQKRGFKTKREAQAWEREQLHKAAADLDMSFKSFVEQYTADMQTRIKENTWATKEHIIRTKLIPYFGKLKMSSITAQQIITWQNELMNYKDDNGKPLSPVYLKTIHNQLSAIFNHAVKYYNLRENPCKKAGSMGKKKNREMLFWTKEEYLKFAEVMMDKPLSYYAFEMLYWTGIREGELLALTPATSTLRKIRYPSINPISD